MTPGAAELWERILDEAGTTVPRQSFATWIQSALALSLEADSLRIAATSRFHAEWLEDKYGPLLEEIAARVTGRTIRLHIGAADSSPVRSSSLPPPQPVVEAPPVTPSSSPTPPTVSAPNSSPPVPGLNARYTFDRFVVGENTRLAQAACSAVADRPARSYNPLFLYGSTGMGKTHLMHAIANRTLEMTPATRVCYLPAEQFVNEMVTAISTHSTDAFRARYRSYDLLLVDDVQFLKRKEHTQEEFFHTFNVLYNGHRQIVLSSDRHPKELEGLEDRLVSRFEWGLVAPINPTDYETRLAILRRKAQEESVSLAPDVLDLVARRCTSSVRQLEGAILKLVAISSVTGRPVTHALARTALATTDTEPDRTPSPALICELVADSWGTTVSRLESPLRSRAIVEPRQVAMYLLRELLNLSYTEVGRLFGGRDHSTVIHSIRRVEGRLRSEPSFQTRIHGLRNQFDA